VASDPNRNAKSVAEEVGANRETGGDLDGPARWWWRSWAVEREGIEAVRRYSERFDGWNPATFRVSEAEIDRATAAVPDELRAHIAFTHEQVRNFAELQRSTLVDAEWETLPGVTLGQRFVPVESVGAYSPGGLYPLIASSIMTVVVPRVAGVGRIVGCAPPRGAEGMHPPRLYAMSMSGRTRSSASAVSGVRRDGVRDRGEPVDMLVGAGNAYVAGPTPALRP
jgi:sulfopropanediol 3-dehydrogenase